MEAAISSVSAPQATPQPQADLRPTADAAAIARDPNPNLPMAIPATNGQSAAVNAARMADAESNVSSTKPTERVLKPYGVAMLPDTPNADAKTPEQADTAPDDVDQAET